MRILLGGLGALLSSCATTTSHTILDPVGPETVSAASSQGVGLLKVYSATEAVTVDDHTTCFPHGGYVIQNADGTVDRRVPNHLGNRDEDSTVIPLPTGTYQVVADSETDGTLTIPVVIQPGCLTVVCLERRHAMEASRDKNHLLVRSPSGQVVGWRASSPSTSPLKTAFQTTEEPMTHP